MITWSVSFQRNYTVYVNKVPVADADLMATNGVVHAVDSIIRSLRESQPLHFLLVNLQIITLSFVLLPPADVSVSLQLPKWTENRPTDLWLPSDQLLPPGWVKKTPDHLHVTSLNTRTLNSHSIVLESDTFSLLTGRGQELQERWVCSVMKSSNFTETALSRSLVNYAVSLCFRRPLPEGDPESLQQDDESMRDLPQRPRNQRMRTTERLLTPKGQMSQTLNPLKSSKKFVPWDQEKFQSRPNVTPNQRFRSNTWKRFI